ncbi:MAG: helix-turn-helix domain-containing protein [Dermatophilaceae bacterium]
MADEFLTIKETASILGVSARHARRLAGSGAVTPIARGLVDRGSVDRYLHSQRQGRTRAWAEHTAWGAVAILSGRDAEWLGATQASRLRAALRQISDADDFLTRMRGRAWIRTYEAHRAALPHLRELIVSTDLRLLGVTDAVDDRVDGYLSDADHDDVVRTLGLRADAGGTVVLRTTGFDVDRVRELVATTTVAALDAAADTDPRLRGVGRRALSELLEAYR